MDLIFKEMLGAYEDAWDCYSAANDKFHRLGEQDHDWDCAQHERDEAFSAYQSKCMDLAAFASCHRDIIFNGLKDKYQKE